MKINISKPSLILLMVCLFSVSIMNAGAQVQISATWFDVNPNNSNTDASSPNGASGGRINHLGATRDFSRIFAASEWGGLYQSFNQGLTWVRINTFNPSATWDVKVVPDNPRRVIATSFFDGRVNTRSGINISEDGGTDWRNIAWPTGLRGSIICAQATRHSEPSAWQISINPTNPLNIFVGTNCGLARSLSGGDNWEFVDPSPGDNAEQVYAVVSHGANLLDVITDNGHFRSNNNGAPGSWSAVSAQGPVTGGLTNSIAVSPAENYVLFAANTNNFFESDDGGLNWVNRLLPANNAQGRIPFIKTNQLSTSNQFDLWFGDVSLFRLTATTPVPSSLGGPPRAPLTSNWTNAQNGGHNDCGDVLFDPRFTAGACPSCFSNDGGVYFNTKNLNPDCQNPAWEQPIITPHATWVQGFDGQPGLPNIHGITYGMQDNGGFSTTGAVAGLGGGVPFWNNYTCCDLSSNELQPGLLLSLEGAFSPGRAFRIFRRNADGSNIGEIPNYPSAGTFRSFISGREIVQFGNNSFAVAPSDAVFLTSNIGNNTISWTNIGQPPGGGGNNAGGLKAANVGGTPNFYYFVGNGNPDGGAGQVFRFSGLTPGGAWNQLPLPPGITGVSLYDVDPTNGNRLIISGIDVANNFSMWRTPDYGANWTRLNNLENRMTANGAFVNLANQGPTPFTGFGAYWQPFMIQYNPLAPTTIIAGAADAGIFVSRDDGNNWTLISNPLEPNSTAPHIPRPIFAYFSPSRFSAGTTAFDVWIGSRGAGVVKAVVDLR